MKFAEKIIWSCLLTVMIVFSIGGTIMLIQNHQHLLSSTIQQNISSHEIEIYTIASKLQQDSLKNYTSYSNDHEAMNKRVIYYIEQLASSLNNQKTYYTLYDQNQNILYSTFPYVSLLSSLDSEHYLLTMFHQHHYMIMTSQIIAGQESYFLTSHYDLTNCYRERQRQVQSFFVIGIYIIVLSFLILRTLSRYLTDSIRQLNQASQRIAAGEYHERTCIQSHDEIGELSQSFDEMAKMNEKRIEQLQFNLRQREEFIENFSHELKTPMTSIIGYADMLRTYDCDENTKQKAVQYIYSEGQRLEKLSYTLMDLLSLSENEFQLEKVDMETIIHQLKNNYDYQNIDYKLDFQCEKCLILSQEDLLFTLLKNLIDNAMKASKKGQTIVILGYRHQTKYHLEVIDEGCGMSQESIEKVTQPFYMIDKSRSRKQGGAGLGLAIVTRICEIHHSTLHITSSLGQGTTMALELEAVEDE